MCSTVVEEGKPWRADSVCGCLNLSTSTSSTRLFPHILLHFGDEHSCHFLNV